MIFYILADDVILLTCLELEDVAAEPLKSVLVPALAVLLATDSVSRLSSLFSADVYFELESFPYSVLYREIGTIFPFGKRGKHYTLFS